MLFFLDAYSRYNQISMLTEDAKKTAFTTPMGTHCCNVIHFGLKNVRATYQRMMSTLFKPLLRHTIELYIDNLLVKSTK